ncbi:MAG: hypothetical protein RSA91_07545 [Bacilli bacterium]
MITYFKNTIAVIISICFLFIITNIIQVATDPTGMFTVVYSILKNGMFVLALIIIIVAFITDFVNFMRRY